MTPIVGLFVVALIEIALAVAVWLRNPRRPVNRWFATFAMTLALWGTLVGVRRSLGDPAVVLGVVRVLFAVAALVPVTFTHFAVVFPRRAGRRPALAQMLTFLGLFMSGLSFSPWIVADVRLQNAGYLQPVYGPAFWLLGAHMILCSTWALAHLAGKLRHTTGFARAQIHYVLVGAGLTAAGALTLGVVVPLVTGAFNRLLKPRTPEEFAAMPRWLAQSLRLLAALFPDPGKAAKIVSEGIVKPTTAAEPKDDPPVGGAVLVLAICFATAMQACSPTAALLYRKQQEACVRESKTLEESRACRARG